MRILESSAFQQRPGIFFEVLDFKDIVAGWGGRAQAEINTRFSGYDIYIGMLWMPYGTPSGATDPLTGIAYESGTEIRQ